MEQAKRQGERYPSFVEMEKQTFMEKRKIQKPMPQNYRNVDNLPEDSWYRSHTLAYTRERQWKGTENILRH